LKIAVSGKGGVGKTTLSAFLVKWFAAEGRDVLAVDADPDANLGQALGLSGGAVPVPISDMKELIAERTESVPGNFGGFFKLNPKVDDLPDKLAVKVGERIRLMVMGGVKTGGSGCVCPENTLLKNLMLHLVLRRDEVIVMDMEAGIEHLGRGTAAAVDCLIVVVEPGRRSLETAARIRTLAADIGLEHIFPVGNKIRGRRDEDFLRANLPGLSFLGFIPYDEAIVEADVLGVFAETMSRETMAAFEEIARGVADGSLKGAVQG
jgi:CO dehydrogenase maturation factor